MPATRCAGQPRNRDRVSACAPRRRVGHRGGSSPPLAESGPSSARSPPSARPAGVDRLRPRWRIGRASRPGRARPGDAGRGRGLAGSQRRLGVGAGRRPDAAARQRARERAPRRAAAQQLQQPASATSTPRRRRSCCATPHTCRRWPPSWRRTSPPRAGTASRSTSSRCRRRDADGLLMLVQRAADEDGAGEVGVDRGDGLDRLAGVRRPWLPAGRARGGRRHPRADDLRPARAMVRGPGPIGALAWQRQAVASGDLGGAGCEGRPRRGRLRLHLATRSGRPHRHRQAGPQARRPRRRHGALAEGARRVDGPALRRHADVVVGRTLVRRCASRWPPSSGCTASRCGGWARPTRCPEPALKDGQRSAGRAAPPRPGRRRDVRRRGAPPPSARSRPRHRPRRGSPRRAARPWPRSGRA